MAGGDAARRQLMVQVPADAVPGDTQLGVNVGGGKRLLVTVPEGASSGDALVMTEDDGGWNIGILPADAFKAYLQESAQLESAASAEESSTASSKVEPAAESPLGGVTKVSLLKVNVNVEDTFERLKAAVRAAGGFVNAKMERKAIPPSGMIGLVATETIEEGEVIARIPSRMHISWVTVQQHMPDLFAALQDMKLSKDTIVGACTTRLLGEAIHRINTRTPAASDGSVMAVWATYCDALLGEKFDCHGYQRWIQDEAQYFADLLPSPSAYHMKSSAGELIRNFSFIEQRVSTDVLGPYFNSGVFLQARLCMLSRVFHACAEYSSLVPLVDLMNHTPNQTVDWRFDPDTGDMVTTANRCHQAGDQLWITYGLWPNPLLFLTYGFTLPPQIEPSWAIMLRWNRPENGLERYLPEGERLIHLDTRLVQDSLIDALNSCAQRGCDSKEFLRNLCAHHRAQYECDEQIKPALVALQKVRAKAPTSADWWTEADSESAAWLQACIRVKMSEYLCLTAHIEAVDASRGLLEESDCLGSVVPFRALLIEGLRQLESNGVLTIKTENSD